VHREKSTLRGGDGGGDGYAYGCAYPELKISRDLRERATLYLHRRVCARARARAQLGACLLYFRSFLRSARPTPASSPSRSRKNRGRAREIRMKTAARAESVNGEKGSLSGENSTAAHSDPKERERERDNSLENAQTDVVETQP